MGKVGFGWRIPDFPIDGSSGKDFVAQILRSLGKVEEGFDSAWLSDHMMPGNDWQTGETDNLEAWSTINYLLGLFKKLSFGHIVLCNSYRSPALLAKMIASLSLFAPGRYILGIGAGWKKDEYLSYGYEFPGALHRVEALGEAVQIIRKMWTENVVHFTGKHYNISGAYCFPKPDPVPPIMIGGAGEKLTLRVVASHADWCNWTFNLSEYEQKLEVLKRHCEKVGRNYEAIKKTWLGCMSIAKNEDEAVRIAKSSPFTRNSYPTITGNPDQVLQRLGEFIDLGVEYFILRMLDFPSTVGIDLIAENIVGKV